MAINQNQKTRRVLFLCTGNYYRSRFAEELFNALAVKAGSPWRADSCGLALEKGYANIGPISSYTKDGLRSRGITLSSPIRCPRSLSMDDLTKAERVIALNEEEHRPLFEYLFPEWTGKIEYWHIADIDVTEPKEGVQLIDERVQDLFDGLAAAS